jgi:hypothetical protein
MRQRSLSAILVLVAGMAVPSSAFGQQQPPAKVQVKTAADLPVHTYTISGKASDFLVSDKPFKEFLQKVKADIESDLAKFDIQDKPTLQQYYGVLQSIALLEGRFDDALPFTDKIRAIELKESKKLMTGQSVAAFVAAKKAGLSGDAFQKAFAAELKKNLAPLPWDKVREDITSAKGRAEMISRELILGQIKGGLDPVVETAKGELSSDLARGLVAARMTMDLMLPLQPAAASVYGDLIAANATAMADNWTSTLVTLSEQTKASAQTNDPDLSTAEQYRQWAARIKDYAAELGDPALAARAGTAAELAGKTADLVPRYRAKPEDAAIAREYAGIGIEYGNAIKRLEYACQDSD